MKQWIAWTGIAVALLAGIGGGYWVGHRAAPAKEDAAEAPKEEDKPLAAVTVAPLRRGRLSASTTAYGAVEAPASEVRVVSAPFESRVAALRVSPGQAVSAGQPLVDVQGSAATQLALQEATDAQSAAERDLQLVRKRFEQNLATNADLYAAENAARTARVRLQSLQQSGAAGVRQFKSESAGIVARIDVQVGQVMAAGAPLVEVAGATQVDARLGVSPADAAFVKIGQAVRLSAAADSGATSVDGNVIFIARAVNPATRLIDMRVSLPPGVNWPLEGSVEGRFARTVDDAWIVPRQAITLDDAGQSAIFTVKDGKAVKHAVRVGVESGELSQVIADDLQAQDAVVVSGAAVLDDAMAVTATPATLPSPQTADVTTTEPADSASQPAASQPAASQPATAPSAEGEAAPAAQATTAPLAQPAAAPASGPTAEGRP